MSGSSDKGKTIHPENIPPRLSKEVGTVKKKSILLNPEYKRGSSKATIQWEESVKGRRLEERMKFDKRNRLHSLGHLMARGSKWSYIQEFMTKLKAEEAKLLKSTRSGSDEDSQERLFPKRIDSLVRELLHGMLLKTPTKGIDLTLDQQVKLELLKHKVKHENNRYLKGHPELDILLSLVYRKLLRTKPEDPKVFVANYVHYLNTHREELVLDEVDVPFDRAPVQVEEPVEDTEVDERQEIEAFVRGLVQKCAELASCGSAVVNVTNIIESILENIDAPQDEDSISSLSSAEIEVREILMSVLTSVARARTRSAEIVVEEILDSAFESVCPSASKDSEDFYEMRESVEGFVRSLLKTVTDKAARQVRRRERLSKFEKNLSREDSSLSGEQDVLSITSRSILKKLVPTPSVGFNRSNKSIYKPELKTKVKFQSVSLPRTPSKETED